MVIKAVMNRILLHITKPEKKLMDDYPSKESFYQVITKDHMLASGEDVTKHVMILHPYHAEHREANLSQPQNYN